MMMRIVRKSTEIMAKERQASGDLSDSADETISLKVGSEAVGQAETSGSLLAGQEIDPESLRFQEIRQEVSKMAREDPTGSADLIRRWVQEST